jgi:hypothetical protein
MRYASTASADAATYALDAWCNPLQDASGRSLAVLEEDAASGTGQLAPLSSPAMAEALGASLGQVAPSPLAKPTAYADLATATAIVPVGADPATVVLHTAYCYASPDPLTGYQVTAKGGAATVDFEVAYSLKSAGHVAWWHLWWQTAVGFGPCGRSICLDSWKPPGASVLYWAAPQRSTAPRYVVPVEGGWDISYPPSAG